MKDKLKGFTNFIRGKKVFVFILIVILIILAYFLFFRKNEVAMGKIDYKTQEVFQKDLVYSISGSGTLEAADSYELTALVEGEVLSANFEVGDIIEKDSILYEIDSTDANSNLEKYKMSLEKAQKKYSSALEALDDLNIRATKDGVINELLVDKGDIVSNNQVIAKVSNSSKMLLKIPFVAEDTKNIQEGDIADITLENTGEVLIGKVIEVGILDKILSTNAILREIVIEVDNPATIASGNRAYASVGNYVCADMGEFSNYTDYEIRAKASGEIKSLNVVEGDNVSNSMIIATISDENMADSLENAQYSLKDAQVSYDNQTKNLSNYNISSPISGTVVSKNVKQGDNLNSTKTALCTILDLSYLTITLNVDELDIKKIELGQNVKVTVEALDNSEYQGVITNININGTTSNGVSSYPVTIRIDEIGDLLPSMNATLDIVVDSAENAVVVPIEAVKRGSMVLAKTNLNSIASSADDKLSGIEDIKIPVSEDVPEGYEYVKVVTGMSDDEYIQIIEGLEVGDSILIESYSNTNLVNQENKMAIPGMGGTTRPQGGQMPQGGGRGQGGQMPQGGKK